MGKCPAFQFYPSDWMRDLDEHPLEIEGAWIRICCKLWWADERGKMTKTLDQWARILRVSQEDTLRLLDYIQKEKIGDVLPLGFCNNLTPPNKNLTDNITVISRRMFREHKNRENNNLRQQRYYEKHKPNADNNKTFTVPSSSTSSSSSKDSTTNTKRKDSLSVSPTERIFAAWNIEKIIIHSQLSSKMKTKINAALKDGHAETEIIQAIKNYSKVLKGPEFFFKYKWSLENFIQRGLPSFVPAATPLVNFLKDKGNGSKPVPATTEKGFPIFICPSHHTWSLDPRYFDKFNPPCCPRCGKPGEPKATDTAAPLQAGEELDGISSLTAGSMKGID